AVFEKDLFELSFSEFNISTFDKILIISSICKWTNLTGNIDTISILKTQNQSSLKLKLNSCNSYCASLASRHAGKIWHVNINLLIKSTR
ncbi:MAG: hypothetical protein LBK06_10670, partial [Planctomycetaceae bacterium]|nr:hypothetical protein [Planctomycetaceae bacterium]